MLDDNITKLCQYVPAKSDVAKVVYDTLSTVVDQYQKAGQNLKKARMYVDNDANREEFQAGGESCEHFFDDLKTSVIKDFQANNEPAQATHKKIAAFIMDVTEEVRAAIQDSEE